MARKPNIDASKKLIEAGVEVPKVRGTRPGQIIPKGKGKWLVKVFKGRDGDGRRKYVSELVHGGKKDAERVLMNKLKEKNEGTLTVRPKGTLSEYLDTWLETTAQPSVRPRTMCDYTRVVKSYIKPHLGGARLGRLTSVEVRGMLVRLREQGLAPRTVRMAHEVLRNALEQAVSDRLLPDNPARSSKIKKALPQKLRKHQVTIRSDQVANFLDVAEGDRLQAFWVLQLMAGLRPSEGLALRWSDVTENAVHITRVLVDDRSGGDLYFAPPKSESSRRAVVVPDVVVQVLKEHRPRQAQEQLAAGPEWRDSGLIFCTPTGEPLRQDYVRRCFKKLARAAELPTELTPYSLRHSCASLLLQRNVPLKVVSERLGHASIALTADTYSHVHPSMQKQAADVMGELAG